MRKLFKERKLIKGGNYMRKYGKYLYTTVKSGDKKTKKYFVKDREQIVYKNTIKSTMCSKTV